MAAGDVSNWHATTQGTSRGAKGKEKNLRILEPIHLAFEERIIPGLDGLDVLARHVGADKVGGCCDQLVGPTYLVNKVLEG